MLRRFIVGKIPFISPLLHRNTLITVFKQKTDLFNNFLGWQCFTMVNNSSFSPDTQWCKTSSRLSSLSSENDDILKLIRSLYSQKAHDPDDISIHMIKICNSALVKLLLLIFQYCVSINEFPEHCSWHFKQIKTIVDLFYY